MITLQALDYSNNQGDSTYSPEKHSLPKRFVSEAEYWEKYYDYPDKTYEWNNGELEETTVSDFMTYLTHKWLFELLEHYLRVHPIAKSTGLEMGFSLALPQTTEVRRPDLGVVLNNNPVPLLLEDRSYSGTYDLCIEAISDSTKAILEQDTDVKKGEYAAGGVKEYYILDGHDRYTAFYSLDLKGVYVPIKPTKGGIIKSTVLPGFQFRKSDLYQKFDPDKMIDDPVYQGFVLPGYSEAKKRADTAEQRAEIFAKQLRALGINPDDLLNK